MKHSYNSFASTLKKAFFFLAFIILFTSTPQLLEAQVIELDDMIIAPAPDMGDVCILDPLDEDSFYYKTAEEMAAKGVSGVRTADFEIDYKESCDGSGWPQQTRTAFEYAFDIWGSYLDSTVPIRIEANWIALEGNTLGSAGPTRIVQLTGSDVEPDTWYSIAQASAMTGQDIVNEIPDEEYDIVVNMNCEFDDWYFGTDANPPSGLIDFVTVILHEVGHGIGFIGSMSADEDALEAGYGFGDANLPIIFDRSTEDGQDNALLDTGVYPNPSSDLFQALTGQRGGIFHLGEAAQSVFSSQPIPLYSPAQWSSGSSYSHLDQQTFNQTENALMRPQVERAYAMHSPGPVFCGMLSDWGWPLGGNCLALVGAEAFIAINETELDFGVSNVGTSVDREFTISNDASAEDPLSFSITIEDGNYSISDDQSSQSVAPGESVTITVRYTPTSDRVHDAEARISHNASNESSPIVLPLFAESLEAGEVARLEQNYPNPFNPTTTIPYVLPEQSTVRLDIYTIGGQLVRTLVNAQQPEGRYEVPLNASDLSSGIYLYRLIVNEFADTRKLVIVK